MKLEQRFIDELKRMEYRKLGEENLYELIVELTSIEGALGNLEAPSEEESQELKTVSDFVDFLNNVSDADQELDYDWINEQLRK